MFVEGTRFCGAVVVVVVEREGKEERSLIREGSQEK